VARALYTKDATAAEADDWGLTVEEANPPTEVWPDNVLSFNTFVAMSTQWRTGMAGPTGLDYGALPDVLRLTQVPRREWAQIFDDIRTMEDAALSTIRAIQKASK